MKLILSLIAVVMLSGCLVIHQQAGPNTREMAIYKHEQNQYGTNNAINESIPIDAKMLGSVLKATGASANLSNIGSGNKVGSENTAGYRK